MRILLQHKIFMGYFLLMAIIGSMVAIVLHERNRVQKIESGRAKTSWFRRFVENYEKRRLDMDKWTKLV